MRITESQNIVSETQAHFARPASTMAASKASGAWYLQNRKDVIDMFNAAGDNTIAAGLKRQVLLQESVFAFGQLLAPLAAFGTTFDGVRLAGTDTVIVPFYPLETAASSNFSAATGYIIGETNSDTRTITINKRKYQSRGFTSSEAARQPGLNGASLLKVKATKLAEDVIADILSVVTEVNFGVAAVTESAAGFDAADVADLREACNTANWEKSGRALLLNSTYDGALFKDQRVVYAQNYGSAAPIQDGVLQKLHGFDYYGACEIPENGEKLVGMAVHRSAIAIAFSPITPAPAVMRQLEVYEVYTDPRTGASFEVRRFGNPQLDSSAETIEANYGYVLLNASALKRICKT